MSEVNLGEICLAPGVKMIPRDKAIRFGIVPSAYKGEQGEPGPIGPQGPAGPEGPRGLKGDKGEQGEPGLKGEKGDPGERGPRGAQGERGEKGEKGERGLKGEKGERGEPDGADGIDGAKGEKGDTGERGPRGEKGDPGPQGVQGEKGEKGDTGERGQTGPVGATPALRIGTVSTLTSGAFAQASISGTIENPVLNLGLPRGLKGDVGEKGEKGDKGERGEPGTGLQVHICASAEYDATSRVTTIAIPDENTIYLVPAESAASPDMFVEWAYINNAWEMFGSAKVDLSNYVQKTDYATKNAAGVIAIGTGLRTLSNILYLDGADAASIKGGVNSTNAIMPGRQDQAVFYGLAKAAGDTTQKNSSNAVGNYTNEAKASIKTMLGVTDADEGKLRFGDAVKANSGGYSAGRLIAYRSGYPGYSNVRKDINATYFLNYPAFLYAEETVAANEYGSKNYLAYPEINFRTAVNTAVTFKANEIVYAYGPLSEYNTFKVVNYTDDPEDIWTGIYDDMPDYDDEYAVYKTWDKFSYAYIALGYTTDANGNGVLFPNHPVYRITADGSMIPQDEFVRYCAEQEMASAKSAFEALGLSVVNGQLCVTYEEGNP